MKKGKRFTSKKATKSFAKKMNGKVKDYTMFKNRKSNYKIYTKKEVKKYYNLVTFNPEEDRNFGYPNWYWQ